MTTASASNIEIHSLYKVFGGNPPSVMRLVREGMDKQELLESHGHVLGLRDINLTVNPGSIQVVMGLSGCGKSTLVRHVNRLIDPTEGTVLVDGQDVLGLDQSALQHLRRHKVSMVFQRFALFPHRTILENVRYGLLMQGVARTECDERAERWIERVGLSGYEGSYPHQLSGGMQQRVGLARALATEAEILLMDEAFSALDPLIRADMQTLLLELQRELHRTILFVTHDLEEAITLGDRIAILRDGEVVQNGDSQEIVLKPSDDYISNFTKNINRGRVIRVGSIMEPTQPRAPEPGGKDCSIPFGDADRGGIARGGGVAQRQGRGGGRQGQDRGRHLGGPDGTRVGGRPADGGGVDSEMASFDFAPLRGATLRTNGNRVRRQGPNRSRSFHGVQTVCALSKPFVLSVARSAERSRRTPSKRKGWWP